VIAPQNAVIQAKKYIRELAPDEDLADLRLEEIKLDQRGKQWLVTLGYFRKRSFDIYQRESQPTRIGALFEQKDEKLIENRVYKQIALDSETGEFKSMRIREVEAA
jgi:hypothetical protein